MGSIQASDFDRHEAPLAVNVRPLAHARPHVEATGFGARMRPGGERCIRDRTMGGIGQADVVNLDDALPLAAALGLPYE